MKASPQERSLRILHVVPAYYPAVRYGGPIRSVHGLAAALVRRGHDVHVYTTSMDGAADLDVPLGTPVNLDGVAVHYFRVPWLRRLCWAPSLGRKLRESVAGFDVVHLHSVFLWPTWAAARSAARANVPYIATPRGMLIRSLIKRKSARVKSAWINLIERKTFERAAGIHVTAELERAELETFRWTIPEIHQIPNGVEWPPSPVARSDGPFAGLPPGYVLFLSRINWKKGLDRLITAWQWVPDVVLVIAGNDDENYRPTLEALALSLGVADRVLFIGEVSDEHKWAVYADAQLFVLQSYSENFGNVVAEAMAMGCAVLVSPEVGIASLVQTAGAGVVTDATPQPLAAAIRGLLADPVGRSEMGRRGREAVHQQLSWSGVADQMESLYRRVLSSRPGLSRNCGAVPQRCSDNSRVRPAPTQ